MLANGTKLGFKTASSGSTFTDIPELKEVPEIGTEVEKVENTRLNASNKTYENGVGDPGDMTYKLDYDNSSETSTYRVMREAQEAGTKLYFQHELTDGTKFAFAAYPSVKLTGGKLNDPLGVDLKLTVASDITVTDPASSPA